MTGFQWFVLLSYGVCVVRGFDEDLGSKYVEKWATMSVAQAAANAISAEQLGQFYAQGMWNSKNAHGYMAEYMNHFMDTVSGADTAHLGGDNKKDGPDRRVGPTLVQVKYYKSPEKTLASMFREGSDRLRYMDVASKSAMQVEVPSDQYESVLEMLQTRIRLGHVEGYTDPAEAASIIRCGRFSYDAAVQACRPGTLAGLAYDMQTGVISASVAGGLSFLEEVARAVWTGEDWDDTLQKSGSAAVVGGTKAMATHVAVAQTMRTSVAKAIPDQMVKKVINAVTNKNVREAIASHTLRKRVVGAAATSHLSHLARSNVVAYGVTSAMDTALNVGRYATGRISGKQLAHNVAKTSMGLAAGSMGWTGGAMAGAALGSVVPGFGTAVGGFVGGVIGSFGASVTSNWVTTRVVSAIVGRSDDDFVEGTINTVTSVLVALDNLTDVETVGLKNVLLSSAIKGKIIADPNYALTGALSVARAYLHDVRKF